MSARENKQEQQHPQEKRDGEIVSNLLSGEANPYNLAELARLRLRYQNFPGAREIQQHLDSILQKWGLSEDELYEKTRQIHANAPVYQRRLGDDEQDWS
jgi:hypothetical protein